MGTIAVGTNSVPYMRVLTSWFDRRRGLAIGIAGSGTGLGFGYVPLVTQEFVSPLGLARWLLRPRLDHVAVHAADDCVSAA